jgi:hypothetical protein
VSPFRLAVASAFAPRVEVDAAARRKGRTIGATVAGRLTWSSASGLPVPFAELEPRLFDLRGYRFRFGFNLLFELPTRFAVSPARKLDIDVVSGVLATAALLILINKLCAQ